MVLDLDSCLGKLINKKEILDEHVIEEICERLKDILVMESNVIPIQSPVNVVGDVHGQYYDVLEIFKIGGLPPDANYLFLGDYVDRGFHSVETITLLACLKLRYPFRVNLLRGNHESRAVTQVYGFYNECMKKYGNANVWKYFTDMFDYLTLSAVIDDTIFCVHGGLSPAIQCVDQIRILDRFREIPHEGPICDIMWSDPETSNLKEYFTLSPRGAGYTFGGEIVRQFNRINNTKHILRAHQLCMEGYQVLFDNQLSTVWSAPNYCYRCGNMASILEIISSSERVFNVFDAAPRDEKSFGSMVNEENLLSDSGNDEEQDEVPGDKIENQYFL